MITRLNFEAQSLSVRIGQAIVLARRLNFVAVATDIKSVSRRSRKRRDRAGRIQFQFSIELQSCFLFDVEKEKTLRKRIPLPRIRKARDIPHAHSDWDCEQIS